MPARGDSLHSEEPIECPRQPMSRRIARANVIRGAVLPQTTNRAFVGLRGQTSSLANAESVLGLYGTELVRARGPWHGLEDLIWPPWRGVDRFNSQHLLGPVGYLPPARHERTRYPDGPRDSPGSPASCLHPPQGRLRRTTVHRYARRSTSSCLPERIARIRLGVFVIGVWKRVTHPPNSSA